jgi:RNA polymerase sigma-70 factor (ECF subfamily)
VTAFTATTALAVPLPETGELIERARAGDPLAFEQLLLPLQRQAFRLAYTMLGDSHAAEDALQEAYLKAWRKFSQFRYGTSPQGWFLTIVANECRSMVRTRWWTVVKQSEMCEASGVEDPGIAGRLALVDVLRRLPFDQRLVLYLYYCEDMSQQDVATALGARAGTIKSRIHRAMVRLRQEMAAEEADVIPPVRAGRRS